MNAVNLDEMLKLGETQSVEFKKSLNLRREALESLCSMINTDNAKGTVIFGIAPDSTICGIEGNLDSSQKGIIQHIDQKFDPRIIPDLKVLEREGKSLMLLQAERSPEIPYHEYDGRAYIREGSITRQLSYKEKERLSTKRNRDKHPGPWKCDHCGMVVETLSSITVAGTGITKSYNCPMCIKGEFYPA